MLKPWSLFCLLFVITSCGNQLNLLGSGPSIPADHAPPLTGSNEPITNVSLSSPSPFSNNLSSPIQGTCGDDFAAGTVTVTTVAANGFTTTSGTTTPYPATDVALDGHGDFDINATWTEGSYSLQLQCTSSGGTVANTESIPVTLDSTIPTVTITSSPLITAANETAYTVSGTCSENTRAVSVDVGGITATPTCSTLLWSITLDVSALSDGAIAITADHDDATGNSATQATANITKTTIGLLFAAGAYQYQDGTFANNCLEYLDSANYNSEGDEVYWIDPDGIGGNSEFKAQCDMTEDTGGWTLVLNYLHQGTTNPALNIRTTDLPLIDSSLLGDDESGSLYWGHTSNSLLNQFTFSETRFYCETSNHGRILHYKTSLASVINYITSGTGTFSGVEANFTSLSSHTATLPASINTFFNDNLDLALTEFPFFQSGVAHWGIKGLVDRWECDDVPRDFAHNTLHRVWIR